MPSPLVFVVISGACMTGTVNHGQTYAVDTSVPFASLRVGDVITFKLGATSYTHRVRRWCIAANGEKYVETRGDFTPPGFERVTARDYIGRVVLP